MDTNPANPFARYKEKKISSIRVKTLENVWRELQSPHIQLLKIDTQGFDLEVLRGSIAVFDAGAIDNVLVEMNFIPVYSGQPTPAEIITFLGMRELHLVDLYEVVRQDHCIAWSTGLFSRTMWRSTP